MSYAVTPMETLKDQHSRIPLGDIKSNVKFLLLNTSNCYKGHLYIDQKILHYYKIPSNRVKCVTYILDNIYRKDKKTHMMNLKQALIKASRLHV